MNLKRGKVLVGAVVAGALGTFAVPFCSNAAASTGTATLSRNSSPIVQLAQEEHHEVEETTEHKVDEMKDETAAVPNAVEEEHQEHETIETDREHHGLHHKVRKAERHVDEMNSDVKGAANSVESEHEEHEVNEKVEHDQ